jgi:hypothetical protein
LFDVRAPVTRSTCGGDATAAGGGRNAMTEFDAIIIGAGQAGPSLAGRLTGAGTE